jgi:cell division protein FtsA
MPKEDFIAALDIGSSGVTAALGFNRKDNKIEVVSCAHKECVKGIKSGVVLDIQKVSQTISDVIEEVEEKAGVKSISDLYIAVRGTYISSINNRGIYNITRTDKDINEEDVANVIANAKAIHIPSDREIMHVIPQQFYIDKHDGFLNPVGMEGSILEADVHIISVNNSHINNISKVVANAGYNYIEHVYHLLPLSEMILSEEEKSIGSMVIDFGDQTTSVAIYYKGKMYFSTEIPMGGYHITNDISAALNISHDSAKMLKEKYGCAISSSLSDIEDEPITVIGLDRVSKKQVRPSQIMEYIQPRVEEILERITDALSKSDYDSVAAGAVITGGGALLKGMKEAVKQVFNARDVRLGYLNPDMVNFKDEDLNKQKYFSAISLLCYPFYLTNIVYYDELYRKKGSNVKRWISFVKGLFR